MRTTPPSVKSLANFWDPLTSPTTALKDPAKKQISWAIVKLLERKSFGGFDRVVGGSIRFCAPDSHIRIEWP